MSRARTNRAEAYRLSRAAAAIAHQAAADAAADAAAEADGEEVCVNMSIRLHEASTPWLVQLWLVAWQRSKFCMPEHRVAAALQQ